MIAVTAERVKWQLLASIGAVLYLRPSRTEPSLENIQNRIYTENTRAPLPCIRFRRASTRGYICKRGNRSATQLFLFALPSSSGACHEISVHLVRLFLSIKKSTRICVSVWIAPILFECSITASSNHV